MRDSIKVALDVGCRHLHIEGDNQLLIQAVQRSVRIPCHIHTLVQDVLSLFPCFSTVSTQHIHRERNFAADWMAKLGRLIRSLATFSTSLSPEFSNILIDDYLDKTLERRDA